MRKAIGYLSLFFTLLLTVNSASASPGRGLYINGQVHRVYIDFSSQTGNGYVTHEAGKPASDSSTAPNYLFAASGPKDVASGYSVCHYRTGVVGEGLAVYDNKIFYAFVSDDMSQCGHTNPPMRAYLAVFDMNPGLNKWTTLRDLGPVHSDTLGQGSGAGAAMVVFRNTLYIFTNYDTYKSTDGINWATLQKNPTPLLAKDYQPLDAITIYPPDADPKILLAYGYQFTQGGVFTSLLAGTWDGNTASIGSFGSSLTKLYDDSFYGYVSLTPGTLAAGNGFANGSKVASVQLFFEPEDTGSSYAAHIRRIEYAYGQSSPSWTMDSHIYKDGENLGNLWVYPWYTLECNPSVPNEIVQRQHLAINYTSDYDEKKWKAFVFNSDCLVPQYPGINAPSCGAWNGNWGGTGTNTDPGTGDPDTLDTLRKYWSLAGVITGPPPFAINNITDSFDLANLSNLKYGQENGKGVTQSQQWDNAATFSAGIEMSVGLFDELLEVGDKADLSYKRAWQHDHESSTSSVEKVTITMGTDPDSEEEANRGRWGWGLFLVPKIIVQDFSLYSYDYDVTKLGTGVSLNQSLHSVNINPDALSYRVVGFDLQDPGSKDSDIPGLMAGVQPFPLSTDLDGWAKASWETNSSKWTVKLGDGTLNEPGIQPLQFGSGAKISTQFTQSTDSVDTEGQTTNIEVSNEVFAALKLAGFKASLTTGYEGSFSTSVKNSTSFATDLEAELNMKSCSDPGCVRTLTVQPYWLVANDATAPWIPEAYNQQRPWCITWKASGISYANGTMLGMSPKPGATTGLFVSGQGGTAETGDSLRGKFSIDGAYLGWIDHKGAKSPVPIAAGDFKPAKGVTVSINDFVWSSAKASGTWTRTGKVWLFESRRSTARNKVTLKLDFGKETWDFQIAKADLGDYLKAGTGDVQIRLRINGKHTLQYDLTHSVDMTWRWEAFAERLEKMELTRYQGRVDTKTNAGSVKLQGTLPSSLEGFGDMTFEINGHQVHVPLMSMEEFAAARASEGILDYEKDGVQVKVDFKDKDWAATFEDAGFHRLHAPRWGSSKIRVKVGGTAWYFGEHPIVDYTARLKFGN